MAKKINDVLKEVLVEVTPTKETLAFMQEELTNFLEQGNKKLKKLKLDAEFFVGGSFAKGTVVKKGSYDVDIFLRFDKKYPEKDLTKLTKKVLRRTKGVSKVHGSREYFRVKISPWFYLEIVPVRRVKNPKESENITDLSYSHVKFINKKIKSQKVLDEIKLGKAFCHATKTYGAESYVHGFSGYSIELLVYHYKTFENFLREVSRKRKSKLVIDSEGLYKNPKDVMFELNGSKLISPIVLIDPTYKERNALAALSEESLERFRIAAKKFLKSPNKSAFFPKKLDLDALKKQEVKKGNEFIFVNTKTKKQEGDIAGTKLLKFHNHLIHEAKKYFEVKGQGFKYEDKKEGKGYLILEKKKEIIFNGPMEKDVKNSEIFKSLHKETYVENDKLFAKKKIDFTAIDFFTKWKKKNKRKIREMYISKIKFC